MSHGEDGECMQQLVSIIVPAYNAERFLARTLRSALQQTYVTLEMIIIDDGSTDSTGAVARAFAQSDHRVRVISVPNGGVAKARNIGISEAAGEFVAFLDADDLWHPTKLERQMAVLDEMKDAAAVYALSRDIDIDDRVFGRGRRAAFNGYAFARHLYIRPIGNGSTLLVRRVNALAVGGYEPSWAARGIGGCEDLDFELKLAAKYPMAAVPLYLVGYRHYPGNMSSDKLRMVRAAFGTISSHIALRPELPDWAAKAALVEISAYAVTNYAKGRYWRLAALEVLHLCQVDLIRTLGPAELWHLGLSIAKWAPKWLMSRLGLHRWVGKIGVLERPLFSDMDPAFGVDISPGAGRGHEREIIQRLSHLDAVLAKTVGSPDERAHSHYTALSRIPGAGEGD
jgi:glycosyltransferase involved in cell wall biosynthesis